jgi:hypothetical protein
MSSVIFNFNGDFHITVTPDSAKRLKPSVDKLPGISENPIYDDGYQALVASIERYLGSNAEEIEEYACGAQGKDIDSIVAVMLPGKAPKVMTESECFEAVERFGNFSVVTTINAPDICAYDLKAAYDPRTVLRLGDEQYIIGPVIVYACDEGGDSISLEAEEVMAAIVYFSDHTVMLCADGEDLPSFAL